MQRGFNHGQSTNIYEEDGNAFHNKVTSNAQLWANRRVTKHAWNFTALAPNLQNLCPMLKTLFWVWKMCTPVSTVPRWRGLQIWVRNTFHTANISFCRAWSEWGHEMCVLSYKLMQSRKHNAENMRSNKKELFIIDQGALPTCSCYPRGSYFGTPRHQSPFHYSPFIC